MRIASIDFFRFVFMLQICLWHMNRCFNLMHNGYVAVEFFFILSGVFIYKSSVSRKSKGVLDYTISKVKRYYPPFLIMLVPTLLLTWDGDAFVRTLNDILFISNTGIYGKGVNDTLWYLSVLVVGGGLIYSMLKHFKDIAISFILPLLVILIYTYIFNTNEGNLEFFGINGWLYKPLARGFAGMSLGVLLGCFFQLEENALKKYQGIVDVLCMGSLIGWIVIILSSSSFDRYALVCSCIIITTCFCKASIFNRFLTWRMWNFLGELTLEMYIVHWALVRLLLLLRDAYLIPGPIILSLYIVMLIPSALLLKKCSSMVITYFSVLLNDRTKNENSNRQFQ